MQNSGKSSISPKNDDGKQFEEEENSCYDNDYEEDILGQAALAVKKVKATNGEDNGLIRYTQEILNGELAGRASYGLDDMLLEDGPQTFDKESEDCENMRG